MVHYRVHRFVVVLRSRKAHEQNLACRRILLFASSFHFHAMHIQDGCPRQLRQAGAKRKISTNTNLQWRVGGLERGRRPLHESWRDRQKFGFGFVLMPIILRCDPGPSPPEKELLAGFASST